MKRLYVDADAEDFREANAEGQLDDHEQCYAAVFAIKTPINDHSGLAHLVEHMVFRGSKKYPCSHELFVINHLLPANINASTQNGYTFYFFKTTEISLFYPLLDYLVQGIVQINYRESELILERDGVLHQELQMYEAMEEYQLYASALRGDESPENNYHYGGFTDTMSKNTLQQLRQYKTRYYQPDDMTLLCSGRGIDMRRVEQCTNVSINESQISLHDKHVRQSKSGLETKFETKRNATSPEVVITWRVHCTYLTSLENTLNLIQKHLPKDNRIFIDPETNNADEVALRLVTLNPEQSKEIVTDCLQTLYSDDVSTYNIGKLDPQIKRLISYFIKVKGLTPVRPEKLTKTAMPLASESFLNRIEPSEIVPFNCTPLLMQSSFCSSLSKYVSVENLPILPKLFHSLATRLSSEKCFIAEGAHWLYLIQEEELLQTANTLLAAEFWSPRLRGELYAMGVSLLDGRYFLYGAQDKMVNSREEWLFRIRQSAR